MANSLQDETRKQVYDACMQQRDKSQAFLDEEKRSGGSNVQLLQKSLLSAELSLGLLSMKRSDKDKAFIQCLQKHVESVLDSSYYQENVLVDKDFPSEACMEEMSNILAQINQPILLVKAHSEIATVLEKDTIQCLHWRPGALMYMYCCTVMNDQSRKQSTDTELLKECCKVGVLYFKKMFEVYTAVDEGNFTSNDENVVRHLQAGIRSDTHMLALAYGGELCYWYHQLSNTEQSRKEKEEVPCASSQQTASTIVSGFYQIMDTLIGPQGDCNDFNPVEIGKDFLSRYIDVARGSVRMQSWNCERPQEILREFDKLT